MCKCICGCVSVCVCVCVYVHAFLIAHVEGVGICGNLKEIQILSDQVGGSIQIPA